MLAARARDADRIPTFMRPTRRNTLRTALAITSIAALPIACTKVTQTRTEVTTPEAIRSQSIATPSSMALLTVWLTGSFSTHAQSIADPQFHDLHIETISIWTDRTDGPWLYFEQASSTTVDQPYKQRVLQLVENFDGTITMLAFELPAPALAHAGAWKFASPLNDLTPDVLTPLDGCAIAMTVADDGASATGGSEGTHCRGAHAGVAYATTELIASQGGLRLWERGYDASGNIVSGSRTGPCDFLRCARPQPSPISIDESGSSSEQK